MAIAAIREDRDPPWVRSMVDQLGKVTGDNLVKSTCVFSYLCEKGPVLPLFGRPDVAPVGPGVESDDPERPGLGGPLAIEVPGGLHDVDVVLEAQNGHWLNWI